MGDDTLGELQTVKDLGVIFAPSLTFKEHVTQVIKKCSNMGAWIMRSFIVNQPNVYLRMYNSHILPNLLYCCVIWNPRNAGDLDALERMQRKFVRRVEHRCNVRKGTVKIPSVAELLMNVDIKYLRRVMKRKGFVFSAKQVAKTTTEKHLYPWRITTMINNPFSE
ncbi:uncharacterized protein B0403.1-like [Galendromus occidentalis]|uniref:Uncharacterized protein B0403.1-like n=1 Tax=Galendromus occidentalis TaxID=34638 RepID=A0AAJ7L8C4_9ACAR|nr:uncharacterized protein B0403.1-like [Galendromus occidentalis]